jgi:hypothetical protein
MAEIAHGDDKRDRRLSTLLWFAAASVLVSAVLLIFGLPAILQERDSSLALKQAQDLNSCRAVLSANVNAAQAAFLTEIGLLIQEGPNADRGPVSKTTTALKIAVDKFAAGALLAKNDPAEFLRQCQT